MKKNSLLLSHFVKKSFRIFALCCFSSNAFCNQLSAQAGMASAKINHGVALSFDQPVIKLAISYDFAEHYYAGLNLFYGEKSPPPLLNRGASAFIGGFFVLNEQQAIDVSLTHNYYLGNFKTEWDHTLVNLSFHFNQTISVAVEHTDDYYGRGFPGSTVALHWQPKSSGNHYFVLSGGQTFYDGETQSSDFSFIEGGLGYHFERWNLELKYHFVENTASIVHTQQATGGRLSININYAIY